MPSDCWAVSDYLATIASDYPATIRHTRGRGSQGGGCARIRPQVAERDPGRRAMLALFSSCERYQRGKTPRIRTQTPLKSFLVLWMGKYH